MLGRPAATRYPQPENRTSDDSTPHPPADRWIEAKSDNWAIPLQVLTQLSAGRRRDARHAHICRRSGVELTRVTHK